MLLRTIIIDDNESLTYHIRDELHQTERFEVIAVAHDGHDGIKLIEELKPDIVILDIIMPKVDGISVLSHFEGQNDIKFVVLSALGYDLITRQAVKLGALFYFVKPIDIHLLVLRLEQIFYGKELNDTTELPVLIKDHIHNEIAALGLPIHLKGFEYFKDAVLVIIPIIDNFRITKDVYPHVARLHSTSSASVEKAMRHVLEVTICHNNEMFFDYFNHELLHNKISNKEFVKQVATNIIRKM